ncbi:hypothetical protein ABTX81_22210 [Kitasatospora sp. NPDC097605]|uniref:hypothetical protein n=1 Tax=Kitasatospora sp. NPDC097605 TaxID=3157226 RepID=UPI00331E9699
MRTTVSGRRTGARHTAARAAAATVLATALAGGTVLLSAPTASAADSVRSAKLKVNAPAVVGGAGQSVQFTETITNTGSRAAEFGLALDLTSVGGAVPYGIALEYRDRKTGAWKPIPLNTGAGDAEQSLSTYLPVDGKVPARGSVTVQLRVGAPMGLPHNGASNGWVRSMSLRSAVVAPGSWVGLAQVTKTIKVQNISPSLGRVPATAVAGGAPIEFDAVVKNPTPSNYVNVANVLFVDSHATVQVRKPNGTWTTLKKVHDSTLEEGAGVYLQGRDSSLRANSTTTVRVRVSYDATTPLGSTDIGRCVYVNGSPKLPFRGTTTCAKGATVQIVAPGSKGTKGQPPVKPAPTTKGAAVGK